MFHEIYCLMVNGIPVTDELRIKLFKVACDMAKKKNVRRTFKGEDGEGMVVTSYQTTLMGTISGILFEADVETEEHQGKVSYIVRPSAISDYNDEPLILIDL